MNLTVNTQTQVLYRNLHRSTRRKAETIAKKEDSNLNLETLRKKQTSELTGNADIRSKITMTG